MVMLSARPETERRTVPTCPGLSRSHTSPVPPARAFLTSSSAMKNPRGSRSDLRMRSPWSWRTRPTFSNGEAGEWEFWLENYVDTTVYKEIENRKGLFQGDMVF